MKEKTPIAATHPMKIIAPTKDPVAWTIMPIAMGVIMPARLPIKLKTPPAKPTESAGAISPTVLQTMAAIPCPKKARVIMAMTS